MGRSVKNAVFLLAALENAKEKESVCLVSFGSSLLFIFNVALGLSGSFLLLDNNSSNAIRVKFSKQTEEFALPVPTNHILKV